MKDAHGIDDTVHHGDISGSEGVSKLACINWDGANARNDRLRNSNRQTLQGGILVQIIS